MYKFFLKNNRLIVTLFSIGYFKTAPGTIGSFISLIILFLISNFVSYEIFILLFFILIIISNYSIKLYIENWRWAGVPFYLRTGKRLKKQNSEIKEANLPKITGL